MGLVKSVVDGTIDNVNQTVDKAIEAIGASENALVETGHQALDVGDRTFDAAVEEAKELKDRLVNLLKEISGVVTEPLP